jgi:SAM-dependent methyltransferase
MSTGGEADRPHETARPTDARWHAARDAQGPTDLDRIYESRFSDDDAEDKDQIWVEICAFLQRFVDSSQPVLDVAADRGYFIRNIRSRERWATDLRDIREALDPDIKFVEADGPAMSEKLPHGYFGTVFMSNYLEHLPDSSVVVKQLREAFLVTRPGGRVIILQPNIRLVGAAYWDFLDHHTALTDKSLREAAELAGYATTQVISRFLPFTTKSRLPQAPALVRWYLRTPPARWLLGKQSLYIGVRTT